MTERELLVDCLRRLNGVELAYLLTGSMASNYWGIPRTTHDVDYLRQWAQELSAGSDLEKLLHGDIKPKRT